MIHDPPEPRAIHLVPIRPFANERIGRLWFFKTTRNLFLDLHPAAPLPPTSFSFTVLSTDYRCEDGHFFFVSASSVTIPNLDLLSSIETGVDSRIRSWKKHLSQWAQCQKAIGGIYFTKKWRAETLRPGLEFDNFKPRLKSGIFKCISWLDGSLFGGWWLGFSESGSQGLSNGTNVAS
jgi:hypothetical protein